MILVVDKPGMRRKVSWAQPLFLGRCWESWAEKRAPGQVCEFVTYFRMGEFIFVTPKSKVGIVTSNELMDNEVTHWISWGVTFSAHHRRMKWLPQDLFPLPMGSWLWRVEIMGLWYHGRRFRGDEWWMPWNILSVPSYSRWTKLELQQTHQKPRWRFFNHWLFFNKQRPV